MESNALLSNILHISLPGNERSCGPYTINERGSKLLVAIRGGLLARLPDGKQASIHV